MISTFWILIVFFLLKWLWQATKRKLGCPNCKSSDISTHYHNSTFTYGADDQPCSSDVELKAILPLRICRSCGFQYTDQAAEDVRTRAIAYYLESRKRTSL